MSSEAMGGAVRKSLDTGGSAQRIGNQDGAGS